MFATLALYRSCLLFLITTVTVSVAADAPQNEPDLNGVWRWENGLARYKLQLRHEKGAELSGTLTTGLINGPDGDSVEIKDGKCERRILTFSASGTSYTFNGTNDEGALVGPGWVARRIVGWRNDGSGHTFCRGPAPSKPLKEVWRTKLSHRSNGSPILVGDRVFVTSEPNLLVCLSAKTGKILWQRGTSYLDLNEDALTPPVRKAIKGAESELLRKFSRDGLELTHNPRTVSDLDELPERYQRPKVHLDAGFTTPTPASDGTSVFVVFGTGLVTSFSLDGERQWCTYPSKPTINWGHASSPVLCGGKFIVHAQDCIALDPNTGKELWRTPVRKRWATPCAIEPSWVVLGGGEVLRTYNGEIVQDLFPHEKPCDPLVDYWGASSPVLDGSSVYFVDATPVDRNEKVRPSVKRFDFSVTKGPRIDFKNEWSRVLPNGKYYASPVVSDGKLFVVISTYIDKWDDYDGILNKRANGALLVLDTEAGEPAQEGIQLGRETGTYHTCTFASNSLWITGHTGELRVFPTPNNSSMKRFKAIPARSHPLFLGQDVILRGDQAIVRYSN